MRLSILALLIIFLCCPVTNLSAQEAWEQLSEINEHDLGYVRKIVNDGNGSMWVNAGPGGDQFYRFRDNMWETYTDTISGFNDFAAGPDGVVWFSYYTSLVKYDGVTFETVYPDTNSVTTTLNMDLLTVDSEGVLWIANQGRGIIRFDGSEWRQYTVEDGLASHVFFTMSTSMDGDLWCSYGEPIAFEVGAPCHGVSCFDGENWQTYDTDTEGVQNNRVMGIACTPEGDVFIGYVSDNWGSSGGISRFDGESWEWITDDFFGYSFVIDQTGTLWGCYENSPGLEITVGGYNGSTFTTCARSASGGGWNLAVDDSGTIWVTSWEGILKYTSDAVAVVESGDHPEEISLMSYPNPFNPSTTIRYSLTEPAQVTISVYSINGQKVETLVDTFLVSGTYSLIYDGSSLSSGTYILALEANDTFQTRKLTLVK